MRGLLRKDIYVMWDQMRVLFVLAVVFSILPWTAAFGSTYAMMLGFMLPFSTVGYDERCRWDKLAAMLPYTPGQIVGSKYLLSGLMLLLSVGVILLGQVSRGILDRSGVDWWEFAQLAGVALFLFGGLMLVSLPLLYRFGAAKGRWLTLGALGVLTLGGAALYGGLKPHLSGGTAALTALLGAAAMAALAVLSFRLSARFYRRRREGAYD